MKFFKYAAYAAEISFFTANGYVWKQYIDQSGNVIHTEKVRKA